MRLENKVQVFREQEYKGEGDGHVGRIRYAVTAPSRRASSLARSKALQSISAPPSEMILDLWRIIFYKSWSLRGGSALNPPSLRYQKEDLKTLPKLKRNLGAHSIDARDWMRPIAHPASRVWRKKSRKHHVGTIKWRLGLRESCSGEMCPFAEGRGLKHEKMGG